MLNLHTIIVWVSYPWSTWLVFSIKNSLALTMCHIIRLYECEHFTHCLSTIMNHQRISTFWFCSPVLLGIHRNLDWKEFLKSCESFLRKVSVYTFTDLNPGFDGPWKKLWIFFVNGTLIMPLKKSFGKKILNFMHGCKSATLAIFPFCQNGTIKIPLIIQESVSGRSWTSKVFNTVISLDTYQFLQNINTPISP